MQVDPFLMEALKPKVATRLPVGPTGPLIHTGTAGFDVGGPLITSLAPDLGGPKVTTNPVDLSGPLINTGNAGFPRLGQLNDEPVLSVAQAKERLRRALGADYDAFAAAEAARRPHVGMWGEDPYYVSVPEDQALHEANTELVRAREALRQAEKRERLTGDPLSFWRTNLGAKVRAKAPVRAKTKGSPPHRPGVVGGGTDRPTQAELALEALATQHPYQVRKSAGPKVPKVPKGKSKKK
jgi:hypothetical protein